MIVLDAEVYDTKPRAGGCCEYPTNDVKDPVTPETADRGAQGHVHRMRAAVCRPRSVRNTGSASGSSRSPGARATTAPGVRSRKSELHRSCHLDSAIIPL